MDTKLKCLQDKKRSIGAIAAFVLILGGVAFALLQSQAKLTGNSIQTESTGLYISQNDSNYSSAVAGYSFAHIIPGSQPSQTEHFLLKNTGSAPLALKMGLASTPANPSGADLSKVYVVLSPYSTTTFMPTAPLTFSLQALMDANSGGGMDIAYPPTLAAGSKEEFNIQVAMDGDATNNTAASLSNIDLAFTGTAVSNGN